MTLHGSIHAGGPGAARAARAGFTLVELVVVVLILGFTILTIVVGAYLATRDKEQLKDEARCLAGFLEQARMLAAITGRKHTVEYNLGADEQRYMMWVPMRVQEGDVVESTGDENESRVARGIHQMPTRTRGDGSQVYAVWIERIGFGDGTSTEDEKVRIDFMPTGGSHWHMVYLRNSEEEAYTVVVNPFTGGAEVYPGEYEPPQPERLK